MISPEELILLLNVPIGAIAAERAGSKVTIWLNRSQRRIKVNKIMAAEGKRIQIDETLLRMLLEAKLRRDAHGKGAVVKAAGFLTGAAICADSLNKGDAQLALGSASFSIACLIGTIADAKAAGIESLQLWKQIQ